MPFGPVRLDSKARGPTFYLYTRDIPRFVSPLLPSICCSEAATPVAKPVTHQILPVIVLKIVSVPVMRGRPYYLTSQRGFSRMLKQWRRLPGHIITVSPFGPSLYHELHGASQTVFFMKRSRCCLNSATASFFGTNDLMFCVWTFSRTMAMFLVMASIAGMTEPCP